MSEPCTKCLYHIVSHLNDTKAVVNRPQICVTPKCESLYKMLNFDIQKFSTLEVKTWLDGYYRLNLTLDLQ